MHRSPDSHPRAGSLVALFVGAFAVVAFAQATPQNPPPPPPAAPATAERPAEKDSYSYRGARRDPFLSLINRAATENRPVQKKPEGVRGLSWNELKLTGIVQGGRQGATAVVQAPDNKSYRLHVGDQLYDTVVKAISADSLVGLQEVNDPLSMQKQREVRKTLRVVEEVK